jgi:hypothetical protein
VSTHGNGGSPDNHVPPPEAPDPAEHAAAVMERDAEPPEPVAPPTPSHVSENVTLVESFAEPGAEDGAGAQVTIDAPLEGYDDLNAKDLIARLADASAEVLAAVELYERVTKNRPTVITAVERQLKTQNRN